MTKNKEHGVVYASIIPSTGLIVYSKTNGMCFANLTALYFTLFNKKDTLQCLLFKLQLDKTFANKSLQLVIYLIEEKSAKPRTIRI